MLTPSSPISVSSRASSPGRSSTLTTSGVKRRSEPCLPGMRATPALPAASVSAIVRGAPDACGRLERGDHAVEVVAVGAEHLGDRGRRSRRGSAPTARGCCRRCGSCRAAPAPRGRRRRRSPDAAARRAGMRRAAARARRARPRDRARRASCARVSRRGRGRDLRARAAAREWSPRGGVMTQGRPRNRSARAETAPPRSRPAIGCEPR